MKQKFSNGAIYTIAQVIFGEGNHEGIVNKNLKTRMAVRQALKFNYGIIANAYKTINEMIDEIQKEMFTEYTEAGKTNEDENGISIKEEYRTEFINEQQAKLNELTAQTVELDIHMIPEKEYMAYAEANDGKFTDSELDILEVFVEFEKKDETENETEDKPEKVEGEIVNG